MVATEVVQALTALAMRVSKAAFLDEIARGGFEGWFIDVANYEEDVEALMVDALADGIKWTVEVLTRGYARDFLIGYARETGRVYAALWIQATGVTDEWVRETVGRFEK
jgi:hypothetical protein